MFTEKEKEKIKLYYHDALKTIKEKHIGRFKGHDKALFLISETYPGIWMEHVYDSVIFARMEKGYVDIAKNTIELFLNNQNEKGQLPCCVLDGNKTDRPPEKLISYKQVQECVSFARLCLEVCKMVKDRGFTARCYSLLKKWADWFYTYRTTLGTGLVEMFVGYDTGHDNSGRLSGMKYKGQRSETNGDVPPEEDDVAPIIAVDMNCNFYGTLKALSEFAKELDLPDENAHFIEAAAKVKEQLFKICYDKDDAFFYDVDKNGNKRKYLSSTIFHLFLEGVLDEKEDEKIIKEIYERHIKNPDEFWTPYPFPSMAINDPSCENHAKQNCWGYYSQALIALRCTLWMDKYNMSEDFNTLLKKWIYKWTFGNKIMFGQELSPITGEATDCSAYYSSCMLLYIYAVRRLIPDIIEDDLSQ